MTLRTTSADVATGESLTPGLLRLLGKAIPVPRSGCLRLTLPNGALIERVGAAPGRTVAMSFQRWRGLWRILLNGERGFADGYLGGEWTTGDLPGLLDFFVENENAFGASARTTRLTTLRHRLQHVRRSNTRRGSRRNIAAHYDLGNAFYEKWLDGRMNYSSALYEGGSTLEAAQGAKLDRIVDLLDLSGSESILEIGCGWGALAERLVGQSSAFVGVTLSKEQLAYARDRLAGHPEGNHADLRLEDYRDIDGRFDRIASIEMLEAVGERYWPVYFGRLRQLLKPGGTAVLQVITISEDRFEQYRSHPDFIQRHVFPGGMLPTISRVEAEASRAGLVLDTRQGFGDSYALTLADWRRRFEAAWDDIRPLGFDDRFRRLWAYYLSYCEAGFRHGLIDVSLFRFRA
ncbi:SAM-dependent methyltransferase [Bauldia litoralis]|uniref:Cyclopropane-fatty-acyl-phospholipid synthase n=1 Tax=Bauldia litoralis TaxID=665467 RepID=A0A1G6BJN0_9HYPH|nr:cyclopropane-fatty-acyl-phospholipid synthase family protein [Bauldia litoralis]SDB20842.1 cyclopropane-fatty-acyl-phospholipid synthase [Bauldia litoralis]